jgi:methyl-accepting chemotaxis protein
MQTDSPRIDTDPPPPGPPRFLGFLLGRRRTLVVDARYQLRVAGTAAGLMLGAALLFAGAIHLEIVRLHEIVSLHDPNIARALQDRGSIDLVLMAALGVGLTLGALLVALAETHRVAGPAHSLRRALARIQSGDYVTPAQLRRGDRLDTLAESVNELRDTLAVAMAEEADLFEALAERVEAAKGEDEASSIGAELRDHAARKRFRLER